MLGACGKKTAPISKDSIALPVPEKFVLKNTDKGIYIKNNDPKYTLFVEKASLDDNNCATSFGFVTKLKPNTDFTDEKVIVSRGYSYRLMNMDEEIGVQSQPVDKNIIYSKPINVMNVFVTPHPTGDINLKVTFDQMPRFFTITLNGKELGRFNGDNATILLEDLDKNTIVITPVDKFNNTGNIKTIVYENPKIYFLTSPKDIGYFYDSDNKSVFLHWDSVDYATGYRVYDEAEGHNYPIAESLTPFVRFNYHLKGCKRFGVSAYNDKTESKKAYVKVCEE
jgi:hypothetical protein